MPHANEGTSLVSTGAARITARREHVVLDGDLDDTAVLLADPAEIGAPEVTGARDAHQALRRGAVLVARLLPTVRDDAVRLAAQH